VEQITNSVTSPGFGDTDDILLGVVQAASSKGCDQADMILNLLEYYDIGEQNLCFSCVTTASITGVFSGAMILSDILNIPLLWFLCRRHMLQVNISHFIIRREDKGPQKRTPVNLQNV
jgi:hypothetical protein